MKFDLSKVETTKGGDGVTKKDEAYYLAKYGNAETEEVGSDLALPLLVPGTLQEIKGEPKMGMVIQCSHTEGERLIYNGDDVKLSKRWTLEPGKAETRCTNLRLVRTSDLHQTQACIACTAKRAQAKSKARREAKD